MTDTYTVSQTIGEAPQTWDDPVVVMDTMPWIATTFAVSGLVLLVGALGWIWHTRRQQRKSTTSADQASLQRPVTIASAGAPFLLVGILIHLILLLT